VLLLGAPQIAHGASIVAVRVWPAEDYSRVTIESDRPLQPRTPRGVAAAPGGGHRGLTEPALRELVAKVRADDPNIAGIRVGQNTAWCAW
jgi:N-acetylmuramoyl-L-alanine amidase